MPVDINWYLLCQVARGLGDFSLLFALMRLVRSLLKNPHIQIEPYVSPVSY